LQIDDILGSEKNRRECDDQGEASHDGVAIPKSLRNESIDEETNNFSDVGTL